MTHCWANESGGKHSLEVGRVSLSDEYRRQFVLRSWSSVLSLLPALDGQVVLDLGCGVGDQALELTSRGARMIGIDANEEMLAAARSRQIPGADFRAGDLRTPDVEVAVDGIWCSFATAYVPELGPTLARWRMLLRPGGWIALTEVDDLFGHEPLEVVTREFLAAYERDAFHKKRYDFHMGSKLRSHLQQAGFTVTNARQIPDRELAFDGPADEEVLAAWRARLERMESLREFCGPGFDGLFDDFMASLMHPDHRCRARVWCCTATVPPAY